MKKVTKAVIPAAGLGTRVLPATKAMPKGMLPIVDKPAIQYLVEEAVRSGITDILIILGRNQSVIEDHFDRSPELEEKLAAPGKEKMLEECLGISNLANIYFVRQKQTLGLGHAVSMAKPFTGDAPFVVIYGDDVIWGEDPVCSADPRLRGVRPPGCRCFRCALGRCEPLLQLKDHPHPRQLFLCG